jgi:hypothetical protein
MVGREMNNEPVAIRYDFDGYGYQYMDSGSGSDWQTRIEGEFLYSESFVRQQQDEITVLKQILSYEGIEVNLNECVEEFRKAQEK